MSNSVCKTPQGADCYTLPTEYLPIKKLPLANKI
jgi:hypothetical protein